MGPGYGYFFLISDGVVVVFKLNFFLISDVRERERECVRER